MGSRLVLLNLLVVALIVATIPMTSSVARIVLGLPFVLFFPGFVLNLALFPGKEGMGGIERMALSFGLSIAVVPLIGSLTTPPGKYNRAYPVFAGFVHLCHVSHYLVQEEVASGGGAV